MSVLHLWGFVLVDVSRNSRVSVDVAPYMVAGDQPFGTLLLWRLWVPSVTSWGDEGPTILNFLVFFKQYTHDCTTLLV